MNMYKINEHATMRMNMYNQRTRQYGMNTYDNQHARMRINMYDNQRTRRLCAM